MSTEHILHKGAKFAISVDERSSKFQLRLCIAPDEWALYDDCDPPFTDMVSLSAELDPMSLAILGIRALQAASYHTDEAEEEGIRRALLYALPGWVR